MPLLFSSPVGVRRTRSALVIASCAWLLILLGAALFARNTLAPGKKILPGTTTGIPMGGDFSNLFAGAVCLVKDCSPYRFDAVSNVLEQHGFFYIPATEWSIRLPLYPPPTLVLFTPLIGLTFRAASLLFYILTAIVGAFVCYRLFISSLDVSRISPLARGLFLMLILLSSAFRWGMHDGNPVILCTGLLLYCCFDDGSARRWLPAICLAIAVLLKPQVAVFFILPIWFKPSGGKQMVLRGCGLLFLIVFSTLVWCSVHPHLSGWPADLRANLALGSAPGNTMSASDRGRAIDPRLNLSYLLGYWLQNEKLDQIATAVTLFCSFGVLSLGLYRIAKNFSLLNYKLVVAVTAAFTLLPVYHRQYDSVILLAAVPWIFETLATQSRRVVAWLALLAIVFNWVVWEWYLPAHLLDSGGQSASLLSFITHRFHALLAFLLVLLLSFLLIKETGRPSPEPAPYGQTVPDPCLT
jgi:Glycosyltransferase family 87